jgi:hypothetical protein
MEKQFREILLHSLVTSACCVALGLIIYEWKVLSRTHYAFQFVAVGITGSLFFHTLRLANVRIALYVLAGLVAIQILYNRSTDTWWVVRDIFGGIALGSALYVFFRSYYAQEKVRGLMIPVTLSALLAATNLVVTIALLLLHGLPLVQNYPSMLVHVMLGSLIGFGMGVGILISPRVVIGARD